MPFWTIFQLCSGSQFLLVEETRVPGENHQPVASHWQTLSHNVISSTPRLSGIRTHNVSGDRYSTDCIETIVRLTSINLQKKILKNPVFKSTFIFLDAY
jgi:hypothetical protein